MGVNYRMGYIWGRWRNDLIGDYIIPALTEQAKNYMLIMFGEWPKVAPSKTHR